MAIAHVLSATGKRGSLRDISIGGWTLQEGDILIAWGMSFSTTATLGYVEIGSGGTGTRFTVLVNAVWDYGGFTHCWYMAIIRVGSGDAGSSKNVHSYVNNGSPGIMMVSQYRGVAKSGSIYDELATGGHYYAGTANGWQNVWTARAGGVYVDGQFCDGAAVSALDENSSSYTTRQGPDVQSNLNMRVQDRGPLTGDFTTKWYHTSGTRPNNHAAVTLIPEPDEVLARGTMLAGNEHARLAHRLGL